MIKRIRVLHSQSFSLMELMVVVVIIGVISAFVLPNYYKTIEREHEKEMDRNIKLIYEAQQRYLVRTGDYYRIVNAFAYTDDLNENLKINLIENGTQYRCSFTDVCFAMRWLDGTVLPGEWALELDLNQDINTVCCDTSAGACPTIL